MGLLIESWYSMSSWPGWAQAVAAVVGLMAVGGLLKLEYPRCHHDTRERGGEDLFPQ
jgi:hypothetical protein